MKKNSNIMRNTLYCFLNILFFMFLQIVILSLFAVLLPTAMPNIQILAIAIFNAVYFVSVYSFFKLKKKSLWLEVGLRKTDLVSGIVAFLIGFLFSFGSDIVMRFIADDSIMQNIEKQSQMGYSMGLPLAIIVMVLLQPLSEEILFRGLIMKRLSSYMNPLAALTISAVLFGAIHIVAGAYLLPVTFLGGLIFGYVFYKSKNLMTSILAHAGANLNGILLAHLHFENITDIVLCILSFSLCGFFLYIFSRAFKKNQSVS